MDVLIRLAQHYPNNQLQWIKCLTEENVRTIQYTELFEIDDNESEEAVRYKTLKLDQVKLNISSIGKKKS
jgi:hypothetical protein